MASTLAKRFSHMLMRELGLSHMEEVCDKNRFNKLAGVCASHDYVDANGVMYDAFFATTGYNFDITSEEDVALWSEAWDIAKAEDFYIDWGELYAQQVMGERYGRYNY